MRITKAKKYGNFGWTCEIDKVPHKTNADGDGLWKATKDGGWFPVVLPTVSFAANDKQRFSKKVRDFFKGIEEKWKLGEDS